MTASLFIGLKYMIGYLCNKLVIIYDNIYNIYIIISRLLLL